MILEKDWFIKDPLDLEHKQYVLLAALQKVQEDFSFKKVYPSLASLIESLQSMIEFKRATETIKNRLKEPNGIDLINKNILYTDPVLDEITELLSEIVDYSLPLLKSNVKIGMDLHDEIERSLKWNTVGIVPKYQDEGYLILHVGKNLTLHKFLIKKVISNNEEFFGIAMEQIAKKTSRLKNYEDLKIKTIKNNPELPCPLFLSVEGDDEYPMKESILPIVKKTCVSRIKRLEF